MRKKASVRRTFYRSFCLLIVLPLVAVAAAGSALLYRKLLADAREMVQMRKTPPPAALDPPVTPDYKRINVEVPGEPVTAHIESVRYGYDVSKGEYDIVDGNYETSWARIDWDSGVSHS